MNETNAEPYPGQFRIAWNSEKAEYRVSIPDYSGGEVVPLETVKSLEAHQSARIAELERENKNLTIAIETIGKNYHGVQQSRNDYAINFRRANAELSQIKRRVEELTARDAELERELKDYFAAEFAKDFAAADYRVHGGADAEKALERATLRFEEIREKLMKTGGVK